MIRAKRLVAVLALFAAIATVRADDRPLLIEIESRSDLTASSVSARGTTVTGNLQVGGGFYWMPTTGAVYIGGTVVSGVSKDGRTIVGSARDPNRVQQAAIWLRGTEWRLLGRLPNAVPCEDLLSLASATNGDGRVVVGAAYDGCAYARAFRWEESTGMVNLGSVVEGKDTYANGVSADGQVVVGYQERADGQRQGTRWVGGRQELIPSDSRLWDVGNARGTNHDGSIVVGQQCQLGNPLEQSAWVWTAANGTRCLRAPQFVPVVVPAVLVTANGTSNDGKVIAGGQNFGGSADSEAIIWIDGAQSYLKDYLRSKGLPRAFEGWPRTGAIGEVSPDGRLLVGYGASPTGFRAYLVILGDNP